MQSNNLAFVIAASKASKHAIAKAVRASTEVGVVVPSILRTKLREAGYDVVQDKASMSDYGFASMKVLKRTLVLDDDGVIVAMGAAIDYDEAILAAMLGWFRENAPADAEVPQGIGVAPGVSNG